MTSTANFTGRSSSKTPRAASRSPRKAPRWQTSIRSASWRPYAATALRCATTAGKSSWERHPATAAQGAFRAKSWRGTSAPNRPAARHPPHSSLRSTPSRPGTSTHASVSTTCVLPTPGKPGATPTRRRAAPSPPSARSSTPGAEPSPCGPPRPASTQRSLCPRAQAPCMESSTISPGNTPCASPTAKRSFPARQRIPQQHAQPPDVRRTTRTTRAGVTAATPPTAYP